MSDTDLATGEKFQEIQLSISAYGNFVMPPSHLTGRTADIDITARQLYDNLRESRSFNDFLSEWDISADLEWDVTLILRGEGVRPRVIDVKKYYEDKDFWEGEESETGT